MEKKINIITALVGNLTMETELEWNTKIDELSLFKFWYMTEIIHAKTSSFASIEKSRCFQSHRYFGCGRFIRLTKALCENASLLTEHITFTPSGCSCGDEELPIDNWNIETKRNALVLKQKPLASREAWNL